MRCVREAVSVTFVLMASLCGRTTAGEIGFVESFALAEDREEALSQLIPGTRDRYYYKCLHLENTGRLDEVGAVLKLWIGRHGRTGRVVEIENRLCLLGYDRDHAKSLEFIRRRLGIHFNHQREVPGRKTDHPTRLDERLISRDALKARAFTRYTNSLHGFEDPGLDFLVAEDLSMNRLRELLRRLKRPDYARLPGLVVKELNDRRSSGFGSLGIHGLLLLDQLEQIAERKEDVLNNRTFIGTYVTRLHPNPDVDWRHDDGEARAYYDRLLEFVRRLAPVNNSLKAHVIYHRLAWNRTKGVYDRDLFMEYIKLPRNVRYVNPTYVRRREHRGYRADLGKDFRSVTLHRPVRDDQPLVREYLSHFFEDEASYRPYQDYIRESYLKQVFAETKILAGVGDMEKWYSMLNDPARYQRLKERVDIDFAPTNKVVFGPRDGVALDVYVKNVKKLIVKVFEINTTNYYRDMKKEIATTIDLDGLVANEEKVHTYDLPPLRRKPRHFEFAGLDRRGVYVVEFIGNGKSSRALIRKGRLRLLERPGVAGHVFTVLDESGRSLKNAALWMDGHEYNADEDGKITVPFTEKPGTQPIVLTHKGFSTLDRFRHRPENYRLTAGFYVERESLLRNGKAEVLVRPALYVNGVPVTLSVLEDVTLTIRSTDREGVQSSKEVRDFKLSEARESAHEFRVPDDLRRIDFTLKAKVKHLGRAKKIDLSASGSFSLNRIDNAEKIEDLHLARTSAGYVLYILGKTGGERADRPVNLRLKHRDFRNEVHVTLQTDSDGRIELGRLRDIVRVSATGPEGTSRTWRPGRPAANSAERDVRAYQGAIHGRGREALRIPYMGKRDAPAREAFSLIERRGGAFYEDRFDAISVRDGFLEIEGLARGDYDLLLKESAQRIDIRLTDGIVSEGHVLSKRRLLEVRNARPLQVTSVETDGDRVRISLANSTRFTRVHLFGTRFVPAYEAFGEIGKPTVPDPQAVVLEEGESQYVSGRDIGDEYRYILDRKYADKYPGNMLKRPGLLLNPWAIRETQTGLAEGAAGDEYGFRRGGGRRRAALRRGGARASEAGTGHFSNLDFLAGAAAVKLNLTPDAKGVVSVSRGELGPCQLLYVVAVDPENTVYREVPLDENEMEPKDLRLKLGLDPEAHATEKKHVSILREGEELVIEDITTSDMAICDRLAKVYSLYSTLRPHEWLAEFSFILDWHGMKPEEKREKYSKYACHELSLFVYRRDPAFFMSVVLPYLKNKKDKTFLDEMLLARDLSGYVKPWAHGRLNIAERALLAQFIRGETGPTARHVRELYELLPPDIERFNHLFKTAIRGQSLEAADATGFAEARKKATKAKRKEAEEEKRMRPGLAPGEALAAEAAAAPPAPSKPAAKKARAAGRARKEGEAPAEEIAGKKEVFFQAKDAVRRQRVRQLFRKLDKTKEWVENNYYHLPIEQQNADLIEVNAFWNDFAQNGGIPGFLSTNFAWASNSFVEMMLAMSLLEIPAEAGEHKLDYEGAKLTIRAGSPMIVFHKEIEEAELSERTPILVSQNFFRLGDRYRFENNERLDKYVTDEFVVHTVYGCQVVLTNPTSSPQKLDLLLQIPRGAMPVKNGFYTRGKHVRLGAYSTATFEYHFYFPGPGRFAHYPVHVAKNEEVIAWAKPFAFNVVVRPTKIDTTAWDHVSQNGTNDECVKYLDRHNPQRVKLQRIAWRMRDRGFFGRVTRKLAAMHVYDHTLWSYGIFHDAPDAVREYLQHADSFTSRCGKYIDTTLLTIDPVVRRSYQHMEYEPLVNARAHRFGKKRRILNDRFFEQYNRLMTVLTCRPELDDDDLMSVTYYMLLQDRVTDARRFFARVDRDRLAGRGTEASLQHDYMTAYLDFFTDDHALAREVAGRYRAYPVPKWRDIFLDVLAQLDEIEGRGPSVIDEESRTQRQTRLAATEPGFEFEVEAKRVRINYQNIAECRVNYYLMDIELLFSRNAFVQGYSGQFSYVRPNETQIVKLRPDMDQYEFELPGRFHNSNVLIEIEAEGVKRSQAYFSNSLSVEIVENYGQLRVRHEKTREPLPKVYVKVYARMRGAKVAFFKDGYTDLRGRFDYTSLSTNELDNVERFSILVLSEEHGGIVREAAPPKR